MQSLILGAGAYLVIERDVTGGVMFAAMFLLGARAAADRSGGRPAGASWSVRAPPIGGSRRCSSQSRCRRRAITLPRPKGGLAAQGATLYLPGLARPVLRDVNFAIEPGETLGIIGPSGAGKSTLARLIVGIQRPRPA